MKKKFLFLFFIFMKLTMELSYLENILNQKAMKEKMIHDFQNFERCKYCKKIFEFHCFDNDNGCSCIISLGLCLQKTKFNETTNCFQRIFPIQQEFFQFYVDSNCCGQDIVQCKNFSFKF